MSRNLLEDEQLIILIHSHPCLYNKGDKDYRDVYQKENIWQFIASSLSASKEEVKSRWTTLRQRFSREKAAINLESRSGAIGGYKPRWHLYEALRFLENHVASRRTISNVSYNSMGEMDEDILHVYPDHSQYERFSEDMIPASHITSSPKILSVVSIPSVLPPLHSNSSTSSNSDNKSSICRSSPVQSTSREPFFQPSVSNSSKTKTSERITTGAKRKREESVDNSITAVQQAISSWQEGLQKNRKRVPKHLLLNLLRTS